MKTAVDCLKTLAQYTGTGRSSETRELAEDCSMQKIDTTLLDEYVARRRDQLRQRDRRTAAQAFFKRAKGWSLLIFVAGVVTAVLLLIWQREPAAEEITHNFPPQRIQSASVPVISNYVIFHKAEWNAPGFGPVTTGVEYEASDDQTVRYQWCYVLRYYEIDQQSGRQQIWVELGSMQSGGRVEMDTFSKGKHESIDVSQTKFARAQGLCQFQT